MYGPDEQIDESQPVQSAMPKPQVRGRRRGRPPRTATSSGRGRGRGRWTTQVEIPTIVEPIEVQPAADATEKPDAHMCLKVVYNLLYILFNLKINFVIILSLLYHKSMEFKKIQNFSSIHLV